MAFRLFVDSNNALSIEPDWDYVELDKKLEDEHRTRTGGRYIYKWGSYRQWKLPVSYVDSLFTSVINAWWLGNVQLLFKSESAAAVYSVYITNDTKPISRFTKPYDTLFEGLIELDTY